jgi:hypothetical protein
MATVTTSPPVVWRMPPVTLSDRPSASASTPQSLANQH